MVTGVADILWYNAGKKRAKVSLVDSRGAIRKNVKLFKSDAGRRRGGDRRRRRQRAARRRGPHARHRQCCRSGSPSSTRASRARAAARVLDHAAFPAGGDGSLAGFEVQGGGDYDGDEQHGPGRAQYGLERSARLVPRRTRPSWTRSDSPIRAKPGCSRASGPRARRPIARRRVRERSSRGTSEPTRRARLRAPGSAQRVTARRITSAMCSIVAGEQLGRTGIESTSAQARSASGKLPGAQRAAPSAGCDAAGIG